MRILFKSRLFIAGLTLLFCASFSTAAVNDKSVQVDMLMGKILVLIKTEKNAEAIPYFEQIEALNAQPPESFYFYYIDTLDKAGNHKEALIRTESYLNKYGKRGKYYGQVLPIATRLSMEADEEKAYRTQVENAKTALVAVTVPLAQDLVRTGIRHGDRDVERSDVAPLITRFRNAATIYMKDAIKPGMERQKRLLRARENTSPGRFRDDLDVSIKSVNEDIGFLSKLAPTLLSDIYSGLERFLLIDDSRAIEEIRLNSYIYSRTDGQNDRYTIDKNPSIIAVQTDKFDRTMRSW